MGMGLRMPSLAMQQPAIHQDSIVHSVHLGFCALFFSPLEMFALSMVG
jgi:hypothetical protein